MSYAHPYAPRHARRPGDPIALRDAAADVIHRLLLAGVSLDATPAGLDYAGPDTPAVAAGLAELVRLKRHALHILDVVGDIDHALRSAGPAEAGPAEAGAASHARRDTHAPVSRPSGRTRGRPPAGT